MGGLQSPPRHQHISAFDASITPFQGKGEDVDIPCDVHFWKFMGSIPPVLVLTLNYAQHAVQFVHAQSRSRVSQN